MCRQREDGQMDLTKLIGPCRCYENAPNKNRYLDEI
jgi:hypothetical protein